MLDILPGMWYSIDTKGKEVKIMAYEDFIIKQIEENELRYFENRNEVNFARAKDREYFQSINDCHLIETIYDAIYDAGVYQKGETIFCLL